MAKTSGGHPLIAGGRTLSKMIRGSKGSGGGKKNKKGVWYQLAGRLYGEQAKLASWPVGEMPADIADRVAKVGSK